MKSRFICWFAAALLLFPCGLAARASAVAPADQLPAWERRANERQPPEQVLDAVGVRAGMVIGEIGAGGGRYTVHLARRVGAQGRVLANDIDESALDSLRRRCRRDGIGNVSIIRGAVDDPRFPEASLDMAFMVWVYHHLDEPVALLRNLARSLKAGAPVVIIDPDGEREGERDSQRPSTPASVAKEAAAAGYELARVEAFLARDLIFVLRRKP